MSVVPLVLVINPGGTSTKVALFKGSRARFSVDQRHPPEQLRTFPRVYDQLQMRMDMVREILVDKQVDLQAVGAVVGRGGPLVSVPSGAFVVDEAMLGVIQKGNVMVEHASLLGAPLAAGFAKEAGCPAYIVDPVTVDELKEEARLTGIPQIKRLALSHALNVKAASRRAAGQLGKKFEEINMLALHLGSGFTIAAQELGRQVDATDATASGPMAPSRAGAMPALDFLRLCFSKTKSFNELKRLLVGAGGWLAHLGTDDIREIYKRIDQGDAHARLVLDATLLQIGKEAGAMASILRGRIDGIVLTGGVSRSDRFVDELTERLEWLGAPIIVIPGENEMEALAEGGLRVLQGEAPAPSMRPYFDQAGIEY